MGSVRPAQPLSAEGIRQNMLPRQHGPSLSRVSERQRISQHAAHTTRGHTAASIAGMGNMTHYIQQIMAALSPGDRQELQNFLSKPDLADETKFSYLRKLYQHVMKRTSVI